MRTLVLSVLVSSLIAGRLRSEEQLSQSHVPEIQDAIRRLGSAEFKVRNQAMLDLLRYGDAGLKSLKTSVSEEKDKNVKLDLSYAARILSQRVAIGVSLELAVDKDALNPGETATLTATLRNDSDEPINVLIGYGPQKPFSQFETGGNLTLIESGDREQAVERKSENRAISGFSAYPLFVLIQSKTKKTFTCPITAGMISVEPPTLPKPAAPHAFDGPVPELKVPLKGAEDNKSPKALVFLLGSTQHCLLKGATNGLNRLRIRHVVSCYEKGVTEAQTDDGLEFDEKAKYFAGNIISNDVSITLTGFEETKDK